MGFYRRIDIRMHGDRKFLALSKPQPNGQTLFERLIHGPWTNGIGLYEASIPMMADRLGWSMKQFMERFRELLPEPPGQDMVDYCPEHRLVWIKQFVVHNPPENPNVLKGWARVFDSLPECHLQDEWIQHVKLLHKQIAKQYPERFLELFDKLFGKPARKPLPLPLPLPLPQPQEEGAELTGETDEVIHKMGLRKADGTVAIPALPANLSQWLTDSQHLKSLSNGKHAAFWRALERAYDQYDWLFFETEIKKADAWIAANPNRAPTELGLPRFIRNWFEKAVDIGRRQYAQRGAQGNQGKH